jgi:hypothetical protein
MPASAQQGGAFNGFLWSPPGNGNGFIGCGLYGGTLYCNGAVDRDDESAIPYCSTTNPKMKRMLPGITKTTGLQFTYDAQGACIMVQPSNGAFGGVTARPGAKDVQPVFIYPPYNSAWGTVSAIKSYPEQLHCTAYGTSATDQVVCYARDLSGNEVICSSTANSARQTLEDQILAASAINEASYVNFTWDNTSPMKTCTSINVWNSSLYTP